MPRAELYGGDMKRGTAGLGLLATLVAAVIVAVQLNEFWAVCASPMSDGCYTAMDSDHSIFTMLGLSGGALLASAAVLVMTKHGLAAALLALVALIAPTVDYFALLQVVPTADNPHGFGVASSIAIAGAAAAGLVSVAAQVVAARNRARSLTLLTAVS